MLYYTVFFYLLFNPLYSILLFSTLLNHVYNTPQTTLFYSTVNSALHLNYYAVYSIPLFTQLYSLLPSDLYSILLTLQNLWLNCTSPNQSNSAKEIAILTYQLALHQSSVLPTYIQDDDDDDATVPAYLSRTPGPTLLPGSQGALIKWKPG